MAAPQGTFDTGLFTQLGASLGQSMGRGVRSPQQEGYLANLAGLTTRMGDATEIFAQKAQTQGIEAQTQSLKQQTKLRQQLFDALIGTLGGGTPGGGNISQPGFREDDLLGQLTEFGAGERARINQQYQSTQGSALAALQQRGWAGSNILPAEFGSIESERQLSMGDLSDRLFGTRLGIQERGLERGLQRESLQLQQKAILAQLLGGTL